MAIAAEMPACLQPAFGLACPSLPVFRLFRILLIRLGGLVVGIQQGMSAGRPP